MSKLSKMCSNASYKLGRMADIIEKQIQFDDPTVSLEANAELNFQIVRLIPGRKDKLECGYCLKSFSQRSAIIKHLKSFHKNAWDGMMASLECPMYLSLANESDDLLVRSPRRAATPAPPLAD